MFVLNVVVGFVGISRVNLPLFLCLRRTTIVFLLLGEAIILQKFASRTARYMQLLSRGACEAPSSLGSRASYILVLAIVHRVDVSLCVGVIALGTIVAGWHSLTEGSASDEGLVSYGFVLANNLCTAGYLLKARVVRLVLGAKRGGLTLWCCCGQSKELTEKLQVRGLNLVFYQSLIGFPLAAIASVLFGEPEGLSAYVSWSSPVRSRSVWPAMAGVLTVCVVRV